MRIAHPRDFHGRLPGYAPTPLHRLPELASHLGVGQLLVKDESSRFGLPAFKFLGASWAAYKTLSKRMGHEPAEWTTLSQLRAAFAPLAPLELITATDGNHGRAVARVASLLGFDARVFVPKGTADARIAAIESEDARVVTVNGTYDEAVAEAARVTTDRSLLIQDTSFDGYEEIPRLVIDGYSTIFFEIDASLAASEETGPDLVVIQIGVGALAAAAVVHYAATPSESRPRLIGVEPTRAACALAAHESGRVVTVPGPHDSIMAGLNCGTVATVAWPLLRDGIDVFLTVEDNGAREAMRLLAGAGIVSGESGAAGLAGLLELLDDRRRAADRRRLGINQQTRVLVISTEGATDPASYKRIVGHTPGGS